MGIGLSGLFAIRTSILFLERYLHTCVLPTRHNVYVVTCTCFSFPVCEFVKVVVASIPVLAASFVDTSLNKLMTLCWPSFHQGRLPRPRPKPRPRPRPRPRLDI
jgi:hypothetical protein